MPSPYKANGWRRIVRAVGYSLDGLKAAYQNEAAFRQLSWLALVLIPLSFFLVDSPVERALLIAVCLLSLIIELINSAIEAVVDRISLERHPLSKNAKDMGSAAQLVGLCLIAIVWALILL